MKGKSYHIAILGATGVVGQKMLYFLEKSNLPIDHLTLLSSARSAGKKVIFRGEELTVQEVTNQSFESVDIALFSAGGETSKKYAPIAVRSGALVIDNTSAYRMDEQVPLVVPEVNKEMIKHHNGIIANPNCSTIQMVVALEPLRQKYGLNKVIVSTYQAVSGAGIHAINELKEEIQSFVSDTTYEAKVLPVKSAPIHHPIFPNVIPQIDVFHENGYTIEELKMMNETKKIMNLPDLKIAATCVRIPIFIGHSESVYIETEKELDVIMEIKNLLSDSKGITLLDNPAKQSYPMPIHCHDSAEVFIGRIRSDLDSSKGLHFWVVADNLAKGAAANSIQIVEAAIELGVI